MNRDKFERNLASVLGSIVHGLKMLTLFTVIVLCIGLVASVFAYTTPTHTFSEDHYTVANSTDGERVLVTFEVVFEKRGEMDTADRKAAMDNMNLAQSCANERLDAWLQSHTADEARNSNLEEITVQCHTEYITIERVDTAKGINA